MAPNAVFKLTSAWKTLFSGKSTSSEPAASHKKVRVRVSVALGLLVCSQSGWALTISTGSTSTTGNYTVSWSGELGCSTFDVYGNPMTVCSYLDEKKDGGQYQQVAASGTSKAFTGKEDGSTYSYRIRTTWCCYYFEDVEPFADGPVSVVVDISEGLLPIISPIIPYPVGPGPLYFVFTWSATNALFCELQADSVAIDPVFGAVIVYQRWWSPLPASGSMNINKGIPETVWVDYELRCTNEYGTSVANGAMFYGP